MPVAPGAAADASPAPPSAPPSPLSPRQTHDGVRFGAWVFSKGKRDAVAQALGLGADASASAMPGSPPGSPPRALAAAGGGGGGGIAVFESASGEFMLVGPSTFKLKDELKAMGASWVSGWALPAAKRAEAEKLIARAAPPPASAGSKRAREDEVKREGEGEGDE